VKNRAGVLSARWFFGILAFALAIAGCSGGSTDAPGVPAANPDAHHATRVAGNVRIIIPRPRRSHRHHPAFVSPSTKSLSVTVNGASHTFDVAVPPCTALTGGGLSCTFHLEAPLGHDTFAVALYDAANATGTFLGSGSQTLDVTSGGFGPSITIVPVTGAIALHLASSSLTPRTVKTTTMTLDELDPDGNKISGAYPNPIALSSSNAAVTLSPSQVTASGQSVNVTYSGSTMMYGGASISASTSGAATVSSAFAIATPCAATSTPANLYAMWDTTGSYDILQYALPPSGLGSDFGFVTYPVYMSSDPSGRIFITQANTSGYPANSANIVYYTPPSGTQTSVTPSNLNIYGNAVDDRGDLFISENNNTNPSVFEMAGPLPAAGSNYGAPVQMPNSPSGSYGLLFDEYCNLFVDGQTTAGPYVEVFSTTGQAGAGYGQATATTNTNAALTGANGMAFDSNGNLFIAGGASINELAPPYTGTPVALGFTIPGAYLPSLAMDASNNLYFADYVHNTINESSPPYSTYTAVVSSMFSNAVGVTVGP
jgi:hypothetical protein